MNKMKQLNRDNARALLMDYTRSESLIKHALSVEAAMRWYARHYNLNDEEILRWAITGLLHDFDYEQFPDPSPPDGHPFKGNKILEDLGYPDDIREAIMGHADYTGVPRTSLMAKALFAVDEVCGLVTACALVRPDKSIKALEVKSVKKKLKDKAFAKGCNRDDIRNGAAELGVPLEEHIGNVIQAMREIAPELGLE